MTDSPTEIQQPISSELSKDVVPVPQKYIQGMSVKQLLGRTFLIIFLFIVLFFYGLYRWISSELQKIDIEHAQNLLLTPTPGIEPVKIVDLPSDDPSLFPGFNYIVPYNWNEAESNNDETEIRTFTAPDGSTINMSLSTNPSLKVEGYLNEIDAQNETAWEGSPSKTVLETKETTVDGYKAIERSEEWLAADFTTRATYIEVKGFILSVYYVPNSDTNKKSQAERTYDKFVQSIKFNKKNKK